MSLPYQAGSATSKAAADSMEEISKSQEDRIIAWIEDHAKIGATRDELCVYLDMPLQSVCGRVNMLLKEQKLKVSVSIPQRRTRSGRFAEVIILASLEEGVQSAMFAPTGPRVSQYS